MKFEQLIEQYSNLAYKIALDMTASSDIAADLVQDSYLSLYANYGRYRHLSEQEQKNILCKIVLNKCRDYLKQQYTVLPLEEQELATDDFVDKLLEEENAQQLRQIIRGMRPPYGMVLSLYYLEERSIDEIASIAKTTNGTVRVQLTRGRKELKAILERRGDLGADSTNRTTTD